MTYVPSASRYQQNDLYQRCGNSGIRLPRLSLGLWHNFGDTHPHSQGRSLVLHAFDKGITHFDLANNYGPPPGAAERAFGRILKEDLHAHRNELIISSKAGYDMWPGPYGDWGSRKYLIASLDESLQRMGLDYVDIFYSHRPDPNTPVEETMGALDHIVRRGKALYVGLSNYNAEQTAKAVKILNDLGTPCLIHQPKYHMFERTPEKGLLDVLTKEGVGCIPFCPLAQGLLTDRYLNGIPADARAAVDGRFLKADHLTEATLAKIKALNEIAKARGQSLAQMALAWVLRQPAVTTALIGASKTSQIDDNLGALRNLAFSADELARIEKILA